MSSRKSKLAHEYKTSSRYTIKTKEWSVHGNPTPLQFDRFLPWLCYEMHLTTNITVERRIIKEDHVRANRKTSSTSSKIIENTIQTEYFDISQVKGDSAFSSSSSLNCSGPNNTINIKSYYNHCHQLLEVAIIDCQVKINRKVIKAINLCLPFHESLKKFTIKGGGLTESVLYEIGKLLPHSNITDVCLDDSYVPEGNYYVLLQNLNQLQKISLCRCKINDDVCKKVAENLDFETPASITLQTLDLTSNHITNLGASYIGIMLRKNRSLLYLNLSDNLIGDTGATHILRPLMLFSLTVDELYSLKKRRFQYSLKRIKEYNKCEEIILNRKISNGDKENRSSKHNSLKPIKGKISRISKPAIDVTVNSLSVKEEAEKMTTENIGEFNDIFDNSNVTYKNNKLHCIGNFKLCYLNLAYNDINYFSLKKVLAVLKYQSSIKKSQSNGLLKVVIEGNNIPVKDELLDTIEIYLAKATESSTPLRLIHRSRTCLSKKMKSKLPRSKMCIL